MEVPIDLKSYYAIFFFQISKKVINLYQKKEEQGGIVWFLGTQNKIYLKEGR